MPSLSFAQRSFRNMMASFTPSKNDWQQSLSAKEPKYQTKSESLNFPLEAHWQLPEAEEKSSTSKMSFKYIKESFRRKGKSETLQKVLEGAHDPKDEIKVTSFRELLLLEGLLPKKHDDYHTLLRFLRMRGFDMLKAKDMYLKMLKWREDSNVDMIAKDFVFEEYDKVKTCYPHGFHGVDKYGRPLYIEKIGMVDLTTFLQVTTIDRYMKYHISEQEKTLNLRYPACSVAAKRHIASTTSILDVKGVGINSFSKPAREIFIEIQKIDSNYYPETLNKLYVVNAGPGFRALWRVIKAFLDARTLSKIYVLGSDYQSKLLEVVDKSNLPDYLGGTCNCFECGGCLMRDKGPWNDPEIADILQVFADGKIEFGCGQDARMPSEEYFTSQETLDRELSLDGRDMLSDDIMDASNSQVTKRNLDIYVVQKILAELESTKQLLLSLLSKHNDLVSCVNQLKELTFLHKPSSK